MYTALVLAQECAYDLQKTDSKAARWVANDALREFQAKYGSKVEGNSSGG